MPVLDKSKLIQTIYELFENDESLAENTKENQVTVQAHVQAFLSGLSYLRYDTESNTFSWYIGNGPEKQFVSAEDFVAIGRELIGKESIDEAITVLTMATHLNPQSVDAHKMLASAYQKQGDIVAYAKQMKLASELEPENEDTHYELGQAYADAGLIDEAIAEFKQEKFPFGPHVRILLGWAYHLRGENEKAIEQYELSMAEDWGFDAYADLAEIYRSMGLLDKAIEVYETEVENRKNYNRQRASSPELLELQPMSLPFTGLGVLYIEAKHYEKAITALNNAIKDNPQDADAHYNLGVAYEATSETDKAFTEFINALKIDSSLEPAIDNLDKLRKAKARGKPIKITELKGRSSRDAENYKTFKEFENTLRNFVSETLERSFGANWWKQKIPESIRAKSTERKLDRESTPSLEVKKLPPIHYTNTHELLEIMERQDNWKIFEPVFGNKVVLESKMQELTILRNDLAHSRKLLPRNQLKLKIYTADFTNCILAYRRQTKLSANKKDNNRIDNP